MQKLNTTLVYILSVVGFVLCCCSGIGVIPAAIGFYLANKGVKEYEANPDGYSNGPAMKTAKTVSLVVTILAALVAAYTLYTYATTTEEERAQQELEQREQLEEMGIELPW
ncbi:MAG: CCC motif membrane protein [Nonlabens sp.]|uniref:CCC motif membrane protein n=1 Tax=Nonlabens sp. TaxID=1888209 RepID=UPI003EFAB81D